MQDDKRESRYGWFKTCGGWRFPVRWLSLASGTTGQAEASSDGKKLWMSILPKKVRVVDKSQGSLHSHDAEDVNREASSLLRNLFFQSCLAA